MSGRIRTVKPEWLEDERLAFASPAARVASIGLILVADDFGRGRANVAWLRGQIFPGDETLEQTRAALRELERLRFVVLYEVDDQAYFAVRNWAKHQRVDKPGKPRVPAPPENLPETPANFRESLAPDHDHDQDHDLDLAGAQDAPTGQTNSPKVRKAPARRWRRVPETWQPTPEHSALATDLGVDIAVELPKFRDHEFRDPRSDANATFRTWLRTAAEFKAHRPASAKVTKHSTGEETYLWDND